MIDLVENFVKYQDTIYGMAKEYISRYFSSEKCYFPLLRRVEMLDDLIDMNFKQTSGFAAEIAIPLIRERYLLRRGFTKKALINEPLITISSMPGTDFDNAVNMQSHLNDNFSATSFRKNCLDWLIDSASKFGSYVGYVQLDYKTYGGGLKTVFTGDPMQPYARVPSSTFAVQRYDVRPINILNYFQDPEVPDPEKSTYRGFIDSVLLSDIISWQKLYPDLYIKENLEECIKNSKTGMRDENWKPGFSGTEEYDYSRGQLDIVRMWASFPFNGNEDDGTIYYLEILGGKIIRFQHHDADEWIVPLFIGGFQRRSKVWWHNVDHESVIPHQNFFNFFINAKAELTLKQLDRFILARRGSISLNDINARHNRGGVVFYDGDTAPQDIFAQYQAQDNSTQNADWMLREVKESESRLRAQPELRYGYNKGGPQNKTLGAAEMMQSVGDTLEFDVMDCFCFGLADMGKICVGMAQQYSPDFITIRQSADASPISVSKRLLLGAFQQKVETTLTINDIIKFTRRHNAITSLVNFAGTPAGQQALSNVQWPHLFREYVREANLGNLDDIMPKTPVINTQQPMMPAPQQAGSAPATTPTAISA